MIFIAVAFSIPAGIFYPYQQEERQSFWKTSCTVVKCFAAYPKFSEITFESHEHFTHTKELTLKDEGCSKYPVGSSVTCYVNAYKLTLSKPGVSGLVCVIFASIFAILALLALIVGCICLTAYGNPEAYKVQSDETTNDALTTIQSAV